MALFCIKVFILQETEYREQKTEDRRQKTDKNIDTN
jgi:hypothetical protein